MSGDNQVQTQAPVRWGFCQAEGVTHIGLHQLVPDACKEWYPVERAENVGEWWVRTAKNDLDACVPKMKEYGSRDLSALGHWLNDISSARAWGDMSEAKATVLGCLMYLMGKMGRVTEALARGELPSSDTLHDITVYSLMARCASERGGWGE